MSREWVDDRKKKPVDKRWVMRCDVGALSMLKGPGRRCTTESEPSPSQPDLADFAAAGWFIAATYGDVCPRCLAAGHTPTAEPSKLMPMDFGQLARAAGIPERPAHDFDVATGRPLSDPTAEKSV